MIYEIRGQKVMLDRDLAELYEVELRSLNQAVKRNIERFPSDFMFQLTQDEWNYLRSQIVIANNTAKIRFFYRFFNWDIPNAYVEDEYETCLICGERGTLIRAQISSSIFIDTEWKRDMATGGDQVLKITEQSITVSQGTALYTLAFTAAPTITGIEYKNTTFARFTNISRRGLNPATGTLTSDDFPAGFKLEATNAATVSGFTGINNDRILYFFFLKKADGNLDKDVIWIYWGGGGTGNGATPSPGEGVFTFVKRLP